MEFFIDSADINDIKKANDMGLVDGVTTNPTLIKKAGQDHKDTIQKISSLISDDFLIINFSHDKWMMAM